MIEAFQGEQIINASIHVRDLQAEGDKNFVMSMLKPNTQEEQDSTQHRSFT
jgi:hypothetical protein